MDETISEQLSNLRQLYAEAAPTDEKLACEYAWIIVKALNDHSQTIGPRASRELLAEYLKLPIECPSKLHSALLSAAVRVAESTADFHFVPFLKLWGLSNLRPEDYERWHGGTVANRAMPSLVERVAKAYMHALLLRPGEMMPDEQLSALLPTLTNKGYFPIQHMIVTRINEVTGKDGRKWRFVTLSSNEGLEVECVSQTLQAHPLNPLPAGRRLQVCIGQLYDVLVHQKTGEVPEEKEEPLRGGRGTASRFTVERAYLSQHKTSDFFPAVTGYIDLLDLNHHHFHIYDAASRHFVAAIQRFSQEKEGQFVRFIPVIPLESRFKSAVIVGAALADDFPPREIRITAVNREKGFASWELTDPTQPIVEAQTAFQQSYGEPLLSYVSGYMNIDKLDGNMAANGKAGKGSVLRAIVFLRRSKDGLKRPYVARVVD